MGEAPDAIAFKGLGQVFKTDSGPVEALRDVNPQVSLKSFADAEAALEYLQNPENTLPNLILLDFNLPKAGSREMLRILKNDDCLRLIPVAVLTTSEAERDIREAYELHANCYLRKPVDLDGFFETIRTAVEFWLRVACTVRPMGRSAHA